MMRLLKTWMYTNTSTYTLTQNSGWMRKVNLPNFVNTKICTIVTYSPCARHLGTGRAALILNLCTTRRRVVSLTPHHGGKVPPLCWRRGWAVLRAALDVFKTEGSFSLAGNRTSVRPGRSLRSIPIMQFRLLYCHPHPSVQWLLLMRCYFQQLGLATCRRKICDITLRTRFGPHHRATDGIRVRYELCGRTASFHCSQTPCCMSQTHYQLDTHDMMHEYNIREHLFSARHQNSCFSCSFNSYT